MPIFDFFLSISFKIVKRYVCVPQIQFNASKFRHEIEFLSVSVFHVQSSRQWKDIRLVGWIDYFWKILKDLDCFIFSPYSNPIIWTSCSFLWYNFTVAYLLSIILLFFFSSLAHFSVVIHDLLSLCEATSHLMKYIWFIYFFCFYLLQIVFILVIQRSVYSGVIFSDYIIEFGITAKEKY